MIVSGILDGGARCAGQPIADANPASSRDGSVEAEPLSDAARQAQEALHAESGNVVRAAERLGISRAKLRRLIDKYRLSVSRR